jgi:N-hydroxyarylamine O-acetyltransferase
VRQRTYFDPLKSDNQVVNVEKYLARIGMDTKGVVPDMAGLKLLQRQHLLNVPFENLDIHWGRPIVLDTEAIYRKIVGENRGGFCYELNGLFNELLRELGFGTRLLSARVADGHGNFSPEYEHASILVIIGEMQYIADVGFGEFTTEPLQFVADIEQEDAAGTFVVRRFNDDSFEIAKRNDIGWRSEYVFKPLGHDLSEFEERCLWHQTSPESHFKKGKVCSLMTLTGRKTLTESKYIVTTEAGKTELPVADEDEFNKILLREFGIRRPVSSSSFSLADQYIQ